MRALLAFPKRALAVLGLAASLALAWAVSLKNARSAGARAARNQQQLKAQEKRIKAHEKLDETRDELRRPGAVVERLRKRGL